MLALKASLELADDVPGMLRHAFHVSLILAALGLPSGAEAEIYRWVDAQGREHFTTSLNNVPASQRAAVKAAAGARPSVNRSQSPPSTAPAAMPQRSAPTGERISGWTEQEWHEKAGEIATEVEILQKRLELLEEQGADHMPASARRSNITHRRYSEYRARYRLWEKTDKDLQRAQARFERFEERARRAGVPPGWLRQ